MEEPSTSAWQLRKGTVERTMSDPDYTIFNQLRLEGKLCDVVIQVNGIEFKAHKNILCGSSSYFRALFTSSWSSADKKVFNIPGVSADMMKLIIEYIYTWTVPVTAENVERLLPAADQFNVLGVIDACCEFLESQLCLENCIGIWKFADCYFCPDLRHKAFLYILHHFQEMVKVSEEFSELSTLELRDIIEKDELNVKQEDVVFDAVIKWIVRDPDVRRSSIVTLLPKVRLAIMKAESFMNKVKNNVYVKDNADCKAIMINALKARYKMSGPTSLDFRYRRTHARLPFSILFAIGGWSDGTPTNAVEVYDARADRWVNVPCQEESPRAYHGTAYLNGSIYIIGGFINLDYFNNVRRFDLVSRAWQQVAPMHYHRCYVSVAVLDGFIYAMGGFDGHVRLNTAERYQPDTNQWSLIAPMQEQRSDASATVLHGKVYICGGFDGDQCLFTAEVYTPETNQWTTIAPMMSRRSGVGVIAYGECVCAVGGFDGTNLLRCAEAYSPLTNTWRTLPNMLNPRSNFGIELMDNLLFVVGGFNGFSTTFNVECYDKETDEWHDVHNMNMYRSALSCSVVPGLPNVREYVVPRDTCSYYCPATNK